MSRRTKMPGPRRSLPELTAAPEPAGNFDDGTARRTKDGPMTAHTPQRKNLAYPEPASGLWSPQQAHLISKLRAVVILAGSMRPTKLRRAASRFVLDLPVDDRRTVLDCWHEQASALAEYFGLEGLPVRVMIDHATPPARIREWTGPIELPASSATRCNTAAQAACCAIWWQTMPTTN